MERVEIAIANSVEQGGAPVLLETDCGEIHAAWVTELAGIATEQNFSVRAGSYQFRGEGWDVRVLAPKRRVAKFPVTHRKLQIALDRAQEEFDECVAAVRRDNTVDHQTAMVIALWNLRYAVNEERDAR